MLFLADMASLPVNALCCANLNLVPGSEAICTALFLCWVTPLRL